MDFETRAGAKSVAQLRPIETRSATSYFAAAVAALGGLLFGYDTAVINGAIVYLKRQLSLTSGQTELAAGSILLGCAMGSAVAGFASDRWGRKRLLLAAAFLFGISSIGAGAIHSLAEFLLARLAGGIAIGLASMLAPLYIAEISPASIRGKLVTLNQLAIVIGILLAFLANYYLAALGPSSWRWMFACAALPSILFFAAMLFVPESPRWLVQQGRLAEAQSVLKRALGSEAEREAERIREAILHEGGSLREPALRKPLIIALTLAALQQLTGMNTILYYGSLVFLEQLPNQSDKGALLANVIIGSTNFVFTIVAMFVVDRVGRRPLLTWTTFGMGCSLTGLSIAAALHAPTLLLLTFILLFVACFATGPGPVVWIIISEIFPTRVRGKAVSLANVVLWLCCSLLTFTFLTLVNAAGISGAFLVYAALSFFMALFTVKTVRETKGKTLEEIEAMWTVSALS